MLITEEVSFQSRAYAILAPTTVVVPTRWPSNFFCSNSKMEKRHVDPVEAAVHCCRGRLQTF